MPMRLEIRISAQIDELLRKISIERKITKSSIVRLAIESFMMNNSHDIHSLSNMDIEISR